MKQIHISQSVQEMRFSIIREMSLMASDMDNVITLGIGEPDFDTPSEIIEKAFQSAKNGHTHYTPPLGDPELLEKLSKKESAETGIRIDPSAILVTHGGMGALAGGLRAFLDPGDHAMLVEPYFPSYKAHVVLAGGVVDTAVSHVENGFIPQVEDLEKALTPRTRVLVLNSPNNPTGAVIPSDVLDDIADFVIKHNLVLISDEVYDQILFNQTFDSIFTRPGMAERTLVIKSFSKSHSMTGWRIGYCYGSQAMISEVLKVVNHTTACANSVGQRAAIAALDLGPAIVNRMKEKFQHRVELVCDRLNAMEGVGVTEPGGSFYIFADISRICKSSREFSLGLLTDQQVVVIPGYAFGDSGEGCIRIACTKKRSELNIAMDRIQAFIEGLKQ